MGGLISTVRDVKLILRDLKITLKFTAKIVLKVHGIVDDVEQTVQELKTTVNNLSARIPMQNTAQEKMLDETSATYLSEVAQSIETTAESVKTSLANAVSVLTSDDLLKNTNDALENLVSHSERNLSGVISRWASVPDGIGNLVKQDCASLTEYIQKAKFSPLKAKKWDERQSTYTPSTEINELDLKKDIIDTSGKNIKQLVKKNALPKIYVKETSYIRNDGSEKIFEIPIPFSINDYISNGSKCNIAKMKILPGQFNSGCNSLSQEDKSDVKLHNLMQTKDARKYHFPESQTEFQTEILSLLQMILVQGFSGENNNSPQKAIGMVRDSQKCMCVGQALMAEYLSCD